MSQDAINVDLAATIADAAGARPGRTLDGVSLLDVARDRTRQLGRDVLLETAMYSAVRTPRYVYVEHASGERELYDLESDPHQLESLHASAAHEQLRTQLAQRLATLRACVGATCRRGPAVALTVRCVGRAHHAALAGADRPFVTRVDWIYRGRAAGADRKAPFQARLPSARGVVRATATLSDGRRTTVDRRVATCR